MKRWTEKQLMQRELNQNRSAKKTKAKETAAGEGLKGKQIRMGVSVLLFAAAVLCYAVGMQSHAVRQAGKSETMFFGQESVREKEQQEENGLLLQETQTDAEERLPAEGRAASEEQTETAEEIKIYVHVCGAVVHPGVYALSEGSRAWEAALAAGGFTEEAAETAVNLAGVVADGQQLWIPTKEEAKTFLPGEGTAAGTGMTAGAGQTAFQQSGKVNINTASKETLMTLAGIGEARAEAILAYRQTAGAFQTIEDIMKVSGIKESAFQKIKDDITV